MATGGSQLQHHVFISYASRDNRDGVGERGWVEVFEERLTRGLSERHHKPQVWRDSALRRAELFDPKIRLAIESSAIVVALLSEAYLESAYCAKELSWFEQAAKCQQWGLAPDNHLRVFPVLLERIEHDRWPGLCQGATGFQFYDESGGVRLEPDSPRYRDQLGSLADELCHLLTVQLPSLSQSVSAVAPSMSATPALPASRRGSNRPQPWVETNHSSSEISFVQVQDEAEIARIHRVLKEYRRHLGTSPRVERLAEDTGSLNYRVKFGDRPPLFVRHHKKTNHAGALDVIHELGRKVHDAGIFAESSWLLPMPTESGRDYAYYDAAFFSVYPYAADVFHYRGETIEEMEDVATKYGAVQRTLSALGPEYRLDPIRHVCTHMFPAGHEEFRFGEICEANDREMRTGSASEFATIFDSHKGWLEGIWSEVREYLPEIRPAGIPLLHDFHPHNTFVRNGRCVLIFDYEAVSGLWSLTNALAFGLHRFVREYVRHSKQRGVPSPESLLPDAVDRYLDAVARSIDVPAGLHSSLHLELKLVNLKKLCNNMGYHHSLTPDVSRRREGTWFNEVRKFLSYLREAELMERFAAK